MTKALIHLSTLILLVISNSSLATNHLSGSYTMTNDYGQPINLNLQLEADGEVNGKLESSGQIYIIEALSQGDNLRGVIYQENETFQDESYLEARMIDGQINLLIMNLSADGNPDRSSATTLIFSRSPAQATATVNNLAGALGIGSQGSLSSGIGVTRSSGQVIAQGSAGNLTEAGFNAYMEALVFCLQQIGDPTQIDQTTRNLFKQNMINAYPQLPAETQQGLANSEQIWNQYQQVWNTISLDQKKEFAFGVLSLAYGQQAAAQALGLPAGGTSTGGASSGGVDSYYSSGGAGGYGSYASDGKCSYFSSEAGSISTCD